MERGLCELLVFSLRQNGDDMPHHKGFKRKRQVERKENNELHFGCVEGEPP